MSATKQNELINDDQTLVSAQSRFGHAIRVYDDGYGPLWIHRDSMGISGIVRAQSWEDAYAICEDEFFPEASETIEELVKEYGFKREHIKWVKTLDGKLTRPAVPEDYPLDTHGLQFDHWETVEIPDSDVWAENELFCEAFGFRPNGPRQGDVNGHGIYAKDLNGDALDRLTPELLSELEIKLVVETVE